MSAHQLLDAAGRPRSPATMPGHHVGRVPPNKAVATRRIRPRSTRSLRSCARPATVVTDAGCGV